MKSRCFPAGLLAIFSMFPLLTVAAPTAAEATPAPGSPAPAAAAHPLTAFAAAGSSFADSIRLGELGWSEEQFAAFIEGMKATYHGRGYPLDDAARSLQAETMQRLGEIQAHSKQQAVAEFSRPGRLKQYMKDICKRFGLQLSDSGLAYSIQPGRPGVRPGPNDTVVVSCVALAADGSTRIPQLSFERVRMKMPGLLPGFVEGFQMMTVDGKALFVLPPALSFGEADWPEGIDRGTPLIFQITLHEVISADATP
jgi:FKBP-type peptidyl-prolyl cis-trans isomerase